MRAFDAYHRPTVSGTFAEKYAVNNAEKIGPRVSHRIVKEGTGTWRFADNNGRLNAGVYEVNDGTLQFASIAETNVVCSLGLATALFSRYSGRYDASKRVAWATGDLSNGVVRGLFAGRQVRVAESPACRRRFPLGT